MLASSVQLCSVTESLSPRLNGMAPSAVETVTQVKDEVKAKAGSSSDPYKTAIDAAISRYETANPVSKGLHLKAVESLPGGNTRTAIFTAPFPVYMKSGKGYQVTSEDGNM
jgi:glutamate-1-semialdehyde 2,1-aminomutase